MPPRNRLSACLKSSGGRGFIMNPQHASTIKSIGTHLIASVGGGLLVAGCGAAMRGTLTSTIGLVSPRLAGKLSEAVERHQLKKLQRQVAAQDFRDVGGEPFWATSGARRVPKRQVVLDGKPQGVSGNPGAPWAPSPNTWGFNGLTPVHPFATPASAWTQESAQSSST